MKYTQKKVVNILPPTYIEEEIKSIEIKRVENPGLEAYPFFVCLNWGTLTSFVFDGKMFYRPVENEEEMERQAKEHQAIAETTTGKQDFIEKLGDKYVSYVDLKPVIIEDMNGEDLVEKINKRIKKFNI